VHICSNNNNNNNIKCLLIVLLTGKKVLAIESYHYIWKNQKSVLINTC